MKGILEWEMEKMVTMVKEASTSPHQEVRARHSNDTTSPPFGEFVNVEASFIHHVAHVIRL